MEQYDAIFIGSGHNALIAAAYLARAGWSVLVLEKNDRPGGLVRTDELTLPGFKHDTYSSAHPLFLTSAAFADLGVELTVMTDDQAKYLGVPAEGPYKPDHYRY